VQESIKTAIKKCQQRRGNNPMAEQQLAGQELPPAMLRMDVCSSACSVPWHKGAAESEETGT